MPFERYIDPFNRRLYARYTNPRIIGQKMCLQLDDSCNPLAMRLNETLDLYYAMESQVDGLMAENDHLKTENAMLVNSDAKKQDREQGYEGKMTAALQENEKLKEELAALRRVKGKRE